MRERIAQFLSYDPRHKLVFAPTADPCLHTVDVGFELASRLKDRLVSPHLAMIAEDELNAILKNSLRKDDIIGDYIALSNWGILFEPSLKLNIVALFDSFSKNQNLILVNCGQADNACFHLISKHFNTSFPMGQLSPYIIQ